MIEVYCNYQLVEQEDAFYRDMSHGPMPFSTFSL
jgi:hypothetical protein